MSERELIHMPPIEDPSPDQIGYFLFKAAFLDEVIEAGGMTPEEAMYNRRLALARIGMGSVDRDLPA